jgi:glycosyltransferase involved in cell wall biosynthesis
MINKLAIVTPHKDDVDGLKAISAMLKNQSLSSWEWIIVDDFSNEQNKAKIKNEMCFTDDKIKIIYNNENLKAAKSRNIGLKYVTGNNVVFLDSDDEITSRFVENRLMKIDDFKVYLNFKVKDVNDNVQNFSNIKSDYLNNFLKSKFAWQTTAVLWETKYLQKIGGFNQDLILLEDIELSVVVLNLSNKFEVVVDNEIDYFYHLRPIDIKKRTFEVVSKSVDTFINSICKKCDLRHKQKSYLSSYYFLSIKYFCRSNELNKIDLVSKNLKSIYQYNCINTFQYILGNIIIKLFTLKIINSKQFLNINRFFYKK